MKMNNLIIALATLSLLAFVPGGQAGIVDVGVEGCAGNYACGGEQTNTDGDVVQQQAYAEGGDAKCGNGALVWQNIVVGDDNNICTAGDGYVCQDASTGGASDGFDWASSPATIEADYDTASTPTFDITVTIAGETSSRTAVEPGCDGE